jgi:hypothetical protein
MTSLQAAAYAAQVLAAVLAILIARRRSEYVPAAVALTLLAVVNVLNAPIMVALHPLPRPVEDSARLLVYLDGAINLAGYAILAGFCVTISVLPEQRRRAAAIVAAVWLLASVVLAALYPSPLVRDAGLQRVYFAADLTALCVSTIALVTWARAAGAAKRSPGGVHLLAYGLVFLDAAVLLVPFSPWRSVVFGAPYAGYQVAIAVFFAFVVAAEVIAWNSLPVADPRRFVAALRDVRVAPPRQSGAAPRAHLRA